MLPTEINMKDFIASNMSLMRQMMDTIHYNQTELNSRMKDMEKTLRNVEKLLDGSVVYHEEEIEDDDEDYEDDEEDYDEEDYDDEDYEDDEEIEDYQRKENGKKEKREGRPIGQPNDPFYTLSRHIKNEDVDMSYLTKVSLRDYGYSLKTEDYLTRAIALDKAIHELGEEDVYRHLRALHFVWKENVKNGVRNSNTYVKRLETDAPALK